MGLKETGFEFVNWFYLAHDRDQWRDLVNTVTKLRFPQKAETSRLATCC
jgi:hypothetical protein